MKLTKFAITILFLSSITVGSVGQLQSNIPTQRKISIKIFFPNPTLPEFDKTCGAGEFVKRRIPFTRRVADAALRQLFAGPTKHEKSKGMRSLEHLGDYYIGVSIKKGAAIINFRPGAEKHLKVYGTACEQEFTLNPIAKTLKQFKSIKSLEYAIKGKIITEWDA